MNDWQASLQNFLDANPELPQGEEPVAAPERKKSKPRLDIILDRKGRAGKTATIIAGFDADMPDDEIAELAKRLRQRLGTGGSARGGEILLQGDRRREVADLLAADGYKSRII